MKFTSNNLNTLEQQIKFIGDNFLMPLYQKVKRSTKKDGSFVSEADYEIQNQVQAILTKAYPDIPLLGEEMRKDKQLAILADDDCFWCLDPLDGTTNFLAGVPYFAISLALIKNGEAIAGIVYDPERNESFTALKDQGAWLNGTPLKIQCDEDYLKHTVALIDFKKMPQALATRLVIKPPYSSQRSFGGIALDWCWLATNRCQLYYHSRHRVWDFAAGVLVYLEAGGIYSRIDNQALDHLTLDLQAAYAANNIKLFAQWQKYLFDS